MRFASQLCFRFDESLDSHKDIPSLQSLDTGRFTCHDAEQFECVSFPQLQSVTLGYKSFTLAKSAAIQGQSVEMS